MSKEVKHTPGPWYLEGNYITDGSGRVRAGRIAEPLITFKDSATYRANAHLIAAAPVMKEALENFLEEYVQLVNSGDAGYWDAEKEPKVIAARAALALANGEEK